MASTLGMRLTMSMDATIVFWLCAYLRYWPLQGHGTCASVLKLDLKYLDTFWRLILICIFDAWR